MASATPTGINPSSNLTEADFLNLLVTQMTSQDPLSPQSDTEFAAQLAQFTALQTAQTTQSNVASLQASQLLGTTLTVAPTGSSTNITGVVSAVEMNAGTPYVVVGGTAYGLNQIVSIQETVANTSGTGSSGSSGGSGSSGSNNAAANTAASSAAGAISSLGI
jgi:flagellar basal-body rod modification protein FlgD